MNTTWMSLSNNLAEDLKWIVTRNFGKECGKKILSKVHSLSRHWDLRTTDPSSPTRARRCSLSVWTVHRSSWMRSSSRRACPNRLGVVLCALGVTSATGRLQSLRLRKIVQILWLLSVCDLNRSFTPRQCERQQPANCSHSRITPALEMLAQFASV